MYTTGTSVKVSAVQLRKSRQAASHTLKADTRSHRPLTCIWVGALQNMNAL